LKINQFCLGTKFVPVKKLNVLTTQKACNLTLYALTFLQ